MTVFVNNELDPTTADKVKMLPNFFGESDLPGIGNCCAEHG
nr:hypothetical protein [Moorena sp. SIOASIH]